MSVDTPAAFASLRDSCAPMGTDDGEADSLPVPRRAELDAES